MGGVHLHVRTCAPFFYKCSACRYSVMVGPIALKFGPTLGDPLVTAYAVVTGGGISARAHCASVSQERLGRLGSILVCELGVMN